MNIDNLQHSTHKRLNILTGEWVLVSPIRTDRPWQGMEESIEESSQLKYDSQCYLCPGNSRVDGQLNQNYKSTYVFDNDFPALQLDDSNFVINNDLIIAEAEKGVCKVVCFSPDHSKSLATLGLDEIESIISVWKKEYLLLSRTSGIDYIQIFENKGSMMGCSNPHPHGQIWAQSSIPNEVLKKEYKQKEYFSKHNRVLLTDYLKFELEEKNRVIFENEFFATLIPFWAMWPFETMIIPKNSSSDIGTLNSKQIRSFAEAIKVLTSSYDMLFNYPFPYSSGIHQAPIKFANDPHWCWHMSFYPPLLRSATIKKYMVGYEMFAMPQRDITPEKAAEILKSKILIKQH